jgi:hypothetical protein
MVLKNVLVLSILGVSFFGCCEAQKIVQLQKQIKQQNINLQNVQSQLEKQKKLEAQREIEERRKIQLDLKASKDEKIFVREYTYQASEDDNKNSSREKAIMQLKMEFLEEIETHIKNSIDKKSLVLYSSEIKSISALITRLEILDEKYHKKNYWIKAVVRINEKHVSQLILEIVYTNEKRLNEIFIEKQRQFDLKALEISKKLVEQEIVNKAQRKEIKKMKKQLIEYKKEEKRTYQAEFERKNVLIEKLNKKNSSQFNRKLGNLKNEWLGTKKILCSFDKRTSKRDIEEISGEKMEKTFPDSSSSSFSSYYYYYSEIRKDKTTEQNYSYRFKCSSHGRYNQKYINNDMHHNNYRERVCPNTLLQSELNFNCIYFAFEGDFMTSRGGCNSEIYR